MVEAIAGASVVYWAGRNEGVAEELTLKTNEITRKTADFMEGTYAVHGIEEVMRRDQVVIWIDPYEGSEEKFEEVLVKGVGMKVIAVASRPTRFPTIQIPDARRPGRIRPDGRRLEYPGRSRPASGREPGQTGTRQKSWQRVHWTVTEMINDAMTQ